MTQRVSFFIRLMLALDLIRKMAGGDMHLKIEKRVGAERMKANS